MAQLQPWQNFYMLLGGASATLVGLMFIAISLGSGWWTAAERSTLNASFNAFMSPTFIHFVYVLVTAVVVLVPTLSEPVLGGFLVLTGLGSLAHVARNLPFLHDRYRARIIDRSDVVWYSLMPSLGYILYLAAGAGLLRAALLGTRPAQALDALAAANVLLMVIGVRNAWDLVVFLVMRRADGAPADRRGEAASRAGRAE
ncbi:MAG TPA: hypothetical protein VKW09_03625 [bacterium]|nr:hypothetical protein [bacterium]